MKYSKAYIRHLIVAGETLGARLLSIHNIRYLIHLTEELRSAIKEDRLLEYREQFIKDYYGDKGLPYDDKIETIIK
jgi:queuine tRNA-ribosyltransferase